MLLNFVFLVYRLNKPSLKDSVNDEEELDLIKIVRAIKNHGK